MARAQLVVATFVIASARPMLTLTRKVTFLRRPLAMGMSHVLRVTRDYRRGTEVAGGVARHRADLTSGELVALARFLIDAGAWTDVADLAVELVRRGRPLAEGAALDMTAVLLGLGEQDAAAGVLDLGAVPTSMHDPETVRLLVRRIELTRLTEQDVAAEQGAALRLHPEPGRLERLTTEQDPEPAGRFVVEPHHLGLRISGWVADGGGPCVVEIVEDYRTIAQVRTDARTGVAASRFRLIIRWQGLAALPTVTRIGVLADGRPLVQPAGGHDWTVEQVRRPESDGLGVEQLTKKGTVSGRLGGAEGDAAVWAAVRGCVAALDRAGKSAFVLYGTLLGAVRDGGTVTGDDDVDVAFLAESTNAESLRQELLDLCQSLLIQGLTVALKEAHGWAAMEVRFGPVTIDVTAIFTRGGSAWAYRRVTADRSAYMPRSELTVQGVSVPVPADPDAVLTSIYGEGWRTPDPGFQHYATRAEVRQLRQRAFTGDQVLSLFAAAEATSGELIAPRHAQEVLRTLRGLSAANRLPRPSTPVIPNLG